MFYNDCIYIKFPNCIKIHILQIYLNIFTYSWIYVHIYLKYKYFIYVYLKYRSCSDLKFSLFYFTNRDRMRSFITKSWKQIIVWLMFHDTLLFAYHQTSYPKIWRESCNCITCSRTQNAGSRHAKLTERKFWRSQGDILNCLTKQRPVWTLGKSNLSQELAISKIPREDALREHTGRT